MIIGSFSGALQLLHEGKMVRRLSWGHAILFMTPPVSIPLEDMTGALRAIIRQGGKEALEDQGNLRKVDLDDDNKCVNGWLPSFEDLTAEDWEYVEISTKLPPRMSERKFHRTLFTVEVLSEEPIPEMELKDVLHRMDVDDFVGIWNREAAMELNANQVALYLYQYGSEPGFFQLTSVGEELHTKEDEEDRSLER